MKQSSARRATAGEELAEVNASVRGAHRVLTRCLPGAPLPTDLAKLRAMLDAHMFGRDGRELRDDAVRVAWQIDSMHASRAR